LFFVYEGKAQGIMEEFVIDNISAIDVAWSPNGEFLAVSDADEILIINIDNKEIENSILISSQSIAWSMDSSQIAAYSLAENAILVFDLQTLELNHRKESDIEISEIGNFPFVNELTWNECGLLSINGSIDLFLWEKDMYKIPLIVKHQDVVQTSILVMTVRLLQSATTALSRYGYSFRENTLTLDGRRAFAVHNKTIVYVSTDNAIVEKPFSQQNSQVLYNLAQEEQVMFLDWSTNGDFFAIATVSSGLTILIPFSDASISLIFHYETGHLTGFSGTLKTSIGQDGTGECVNLKTY
jgi:WD40 repeat protein